jgi:archaetidylinositol phosphate synthase
MSALRVNLNVLREQEAAAVRYLVTRLPAWCTPDQLTGLSVLGAIIAAVSLVCCRQSSWFVLAVIFGLGVNWFGDSLDGALARIRKNERPRIGYLIDRGADVASFSVIIIGFGLSPYLSLLSALLLLLVYFVHTIYSLLRNVIDRIQLVGLGGIGATEGRLLVGAWAAFVELVGRDLVQTRIFGFLLLDIFYVALFIVAILNFIVRIIVDIRRISELEARRSRDATASGAENVVPILRSEASRSNSRRYGVAEDRKGRFVLGPSKKSLLPL